MNQFDCAPGGFRGWGGGGLGTCPIRTVIVTVYIFILQHQNLEVYIPMIYNLFRVIALLL